MTIQTPEQIGMPLDEFLAEQNEQPYELLFGERIMLTPDVAGQSWLIHELFEQIDAFVEGHALGDVFIKASYFEMIGREWVKSAREPDLAFFADGGIERFMRDNPDWRLRPLTVIPALTIEVIAPRDPYDAVARKVNFDQASGVRLIWLVDFQLDQVTEHYNGQIRILNLGATLDGKDVLPGFTLALDDLFAKTP